MLRSSPSERQVCDCYSLYFASFCKCVVVAKGNKTPKLTRTSSGAAPPAASKVDEELFEDSPATPRAKKQKPADRKLVHAVVKSVTPEGGARKSPSDDGGGAVAKVAKKGGSKSPKRPKHLSRSATWAPSRPVKVRETKGTI